jgi:GNAT superfamily N-acetyltransferase
MSKTGVQFRELDLSNKSEVGFVYKSWMGSYKNHAGVIPYGMYRDIMQVFLDRIIKRDGCIVVLITHPNDPDFLFGFAVGERDTPTLHYIYVKEDYRRTGVATDTLEFLGLENFEYTHSTSLGRKFLNPRGGKHRPQFVRNELP